MYEKKGKRVVVDSSSKYSLFVIHGVIVCCSSEAEK